MSQARSEATKKLINEPELCVEHSLLGCAMRNDSVVLLKQYPVLIRRQEVVSSSGESDRVAVVAGGGSGHEPAFAGMVGYGGLTAAIAGNVFASPPPEHVLAALMAVRRSAGILLLVINYTGDRLNFGIAVERAKQLAPESPVEMVIFGEDCALQSTDRSAGRRGLAACLFAIKICGAMADDKVPLRDIADAARKIQENAGTIGVGLSSCSPPGRGPLFQISNTEMELGLGIHGEPGVRRVPLATAEQTVRMMLNHMTSPISSTCYKINDGDEVVVLLNNLGATSQLEMNILSYEVLRWLKDRRLSVLRIYMGTCMTSLDMHGFSISLLRIEDKGWLNYLDADHDFVGWPLGSVPSIQDLRVGDVEGTTWSMVEKGVEACEAVASKIENALLAACDAIAENEGKINELDSSCGDGDCGTTLKRAADYIRSQCTKKNLTINNPSALFCEIAKIFEEKVGGTTGALYALFFSAASQAVKTSLDLKAWAAAVVSGTQAVRHYGKAEPGDRTLVDPLCKVAETLQTAANQGKTTARQLYDLIATAVDQAVQATKDMVAYVGRASYVARENLTNPDPGAYAVSVILKAVLSKL